MGFGRTKARVTVGALAPDFTLPSQSGEMVSLGDFLGKSPVVVFFYPKDNTLGCTKEVCTFRDSFEELSNLDAEVIGISSDSVDSHKDFAEKHNLPFTLLSDEGGKVRSLYGVPNSFGLDSLGRYYASVRPKRLRNKRQVRNSYGRRRGAGQVQRLVAAWG
jgi:peroxiredoxin Q/BCP